jgi:hypothetical protein
MDEDIYRETYRRLNPLPCVFEKAILRTCCRCALAQKLNLAEREAVACTRADAQNTCRSVLDTMHDNAIFAVHAPGTPGPLPHGKEIRIQCGGLLGLKQIMDPDSADDKIDVHALLRSALDRYGDSAHLPHQDIVRVISSYRNRRRQQPG